MLVFAHILLPMTDPMADTETDIADIKSTLARLEPMLVKVLDGQAKLEAGHAKLEGGQARLEAGYAKLEADVARIDAKIDAVETRLHNDIQQVRRETASAYFTAKGRTDQLSDQLREHIGGHEHKPAAAAAE